MPKMIKHGKEFIHTTALPDNLSVEGDLDLRNSDITALPDNFSVGGSLDLSYSDITALPDNLSGRKSLPERNTHLFLAQ